MAWGATVVGIKGPNIDLIFYEDQSGQQLPYSTTIPGNAPLSWLSDLVAEMIVSFTTAQQTAATQAATLAQVTLGVVTPTESIVGSTPVASAAAAPIVAQPIGPALPGQVAS